MPESWSAIVRRYRLRHSLTQESLGAMLGVSQRTISRWERGEDRPGLKQQKRLRDLAWNPEAMLSARLFAAVENCPAPRALSQMPNLRLLALSPPAIEKRPSVTEWIGRDLNRIATGILAEMLDDRALQASIARGEIACVLTTTQSVLRTRESVRIGAYRTTISYFFHDGTLYSDAISVATAPDAVCGYRAVPMDGVFGD
jgi:transcriptional regulator with XRE-family HTH domain